MPRISAKTVAEHREIVQRRLVDAAEEILRSGDASELTAGVVAQKAGIARNSIYRYVNSVDDLHGLVLGRHLPAWMDAVRAELDQVHDPEERIVVWMRANLEQASASGHGWLMGLGSSNPSEVTREVMESAHGVMRGALHEAVGALVSDASRARVIEGLLRGMLEAGFKQLDAGVTPDVVIATAASSAQAVVDGLKD